MADYKPGEKFRRDWIAELEAKLAALDGSHWPADTADGAKVFASVAFPDWTPRLEWERKIRELRKELGEGVGAYPRYVKSEDDRFAGWTEERIMAAESNAIAVMGETKRG